VSMQLERRLSELIGNVQLIGADDSSWPTAAVAIRPKAEVHDRPLPEWGLTPIRRRTRIKWSHRRNSLKQRQLRRIIRKNNGVLHGQELADPDLMRIRLNIGGPQTIILAQVNE
ncbi:MAG: hypothetical protein OEU99_17630, partial [Nitrospira sp.]|nr:hypothetical protein [Nitrospira sp.]